MAAPGWAWVILAGAALSILGCLAGSARPAVLDKPDITYEVVGQNTGDAFAWTGHPEEAFASYAKVLAASPRHVGVLNNKASLQFQLGQVDEAIQTYEACLRVQPDHAEALCNYGNALAAQGRLVEAAAPLEKGLALKPDHLPATISLAWIQAASEDARVRQPESALKLAQKAETVMGQNQPAVMRSLAAALAANGRFQEATDQAAKAAVICEQLGDATSASQMRSQAEAYRSGTALHLPSRPPR